MRTQNKYIALTDIINTKCKDKKFSEIFQRELLINTIAKIVVNLRRKARLTQKELADKAETSQPVIARLESGSDHRVPSLELLAKIAIAANMNLKITIEKQRQKLSG